MQYVSIYIKFKRDAYISGKTLKKNTVLVILKVRRVITWEGAGTGWGGLLVGGGFVLFLDLGDRHMNVCIL